METRHPVQCYFGNEFLSLCNHCGVMAAWNRKTLKKIDFLRFLGKDPLQENFQNSVPKGFITTPIDVMCSNFVKLGRREIGKILCCLPDKTKQNFASISRYSYWAERAFGWSSIKPNKKYTIELSHLAYSSSEHWLWPRFVFAPAIRFFLTTYGASPNSYNINRDV